METETTNNRQADLTADKVAFWAILIVVFLIPLFFIPTASVPFQFAKIILLYAGIAVTFCACIIARLKDGVIKVPWHYLFLSLFAIPVVQTLAALFSPVKNASLIGQGFEIGTAAFIVAVSFFALFIGYFFTTKGRIAYAYFAFLLPVPLVMLFQLIRLLAGAGALSFGIFTSLPVTIIGGWNDLGIYFGAAALFAFIALELVELDRWIKITFSIVLAFSLFFLSVVNFSSIWYLLALLAVVFFVYNFSFNSTRVITSDYESGSESIGGRTEHTQRRVPVTSLIVVIVSVIFILLHGNFYTTFPFLNKLAVSNLEVRPSWSGTWHVVKASLASHPIFGIGPNRFTSQWLLSKPAGVNSTIFWGTDFNYGVGLIPTFLSTTGILGGLAWLIFFVLYIWTGYKALFIKTEDPFIRYAVVSSFIISVYFWIFAIIYVPSAALLVLTFFFTGIFMATLSQLGLSRIYSFNFVREPRLSFISVLVFIALLLGMIAAGYTVTRKFIADIYYNNALIVANSKGDIQGAETRLLQAIQLSPDAQFYRTLSNLYLVRMNILLQQSGISQDALQNQFRDIFANARQSAINAIALDGTDYQNYVALGQVYESVVPLNISGAYDQAAATYNQAIQLNPQNPALYLVLARLDVAHNDINKSKQDIQQALNLKSDYTDAVFFLAQVQANEGDLKNAITSAEAAAYLNPNDPGIYFELGLLRYDNKDYNGAASAFQQAVALVPDYANAKYFLGLSDYHLGKTQDALQQFQDIQKTNSDNQEVAQIISNLQAGRDPLAGLQPPANQPQSAPNPPVKDSTTKSSAPATQGR